MKTKALKITIAVLVGIVLGVAILLVLIKVGERIVFARFYFNAETEFKVPGLADGLVQQGFDYYEGDPDTDDDDRFLVSGYMKNDEKSSRIYVLNKDGKVVHHAELKNMDGGHNKTHAGGIAIYGDYVYVANDLEKYGFVGLQVFSLDDIINKDTANCIGEIKLGINPATCYVDKEKSILYVANFHYEKSDYVSPEEHKLQTPCGDNNTAIMLAYELGAGADFGFKDYQPDKAYSITSKVQGLTFTDSGKIVLSTSYSISKSHLLMYDFEKAEQGKETTKLFGGEIPLYHLDSSCLVKDVKAPPMAEELVFLDGRIYIMNESASNKYIFGRLLSGTYVHSYKAD